MLPTTALTSSRNQLFSPDVVNSETPEEKTEIIKTILKSEITPEGLIRDDIDNQTLQEKLKIVARYYQDAIDAAMRLKPFLGRLLLLYESRPKLYRDMGYRNWNHWLSQGAFEQHGICRNEAYKCVRIARHLGHLTPADYVEIGIEKLDTLSFAAKSMDLQKDTSDAKHRRFDEWVQKGKTLTNEELKKELEAKLLISPGELDPRVDLVIKVNPDIKHLWSEFKQNPAILDYVGGTDESLIFQRLLEECSTEWLAQGNGH